MNFFFRLGSLDSSSKLKIVSIATSVWGKIEIFEDPSFLLIHPKEDFQHYRIDDDEILGFIDGWGSDCTESNPLKSTRNFFKQIQKSWPITSSDFSGCFSGLIYEKRSANLKIFSDSSGIYPLYYSMVEGKCIGGTSQIIIGKFLESDIDPVGLLEMISPPHFCTYGARTILKNVFQVLPGELINISEAKVKTKSYDNLLFGGEILENNKDQTQELWEIVKSDVKACSLPQKKINLGMSGGWDSRLIAGALQGLDKELTFFTYGLDQNEYEAKIAEKCSKVANADYKFCSTYSSYFPDSETFRKNVELTESAFIPSWFPILQSNPNIEKEFFFLGDMFEVITGKNIISLTSRVSRRARFLHPSINLSIVQEATKGRFANWSYQMINDQLRLFTLEIDRIDNNLINPSNQKEIKEQLLEDLCVYIERIKSHEFKYSNLYDELFGWYTRGKSISRQFLCLKQRFTPLAPTMGFRYLRFASKINPIIRSDGKLLQAIQTLPDLHKLSSLPSATIPFIPSFFPLWLKNIVWGGRSIIDQKIIRRAVRKRNKNTRYRLLRSENLITLYNHPEAKKRTHQYFKKSPLDGMYYEGLVRLRASLMAWPMINTDIMGPANAAMLVKLIKGYLPK